MLVCLYVFLGCTRACDGDVVCVGHNLNREYKYVLRCTYVIIKHIIFIKLSEKMDKWTVGLHNGDRYDIIHFTIYNVVFTKML